MVEMKKNVDDKRVRDRARTELGRKLDDWKFMVDEYLGRIIDRASLPEPIIAEAMNHSLLAGGKRLRPLICLAAAATFGLHAEVIMEVASAIELVHTYSLVHDDLPAMDDDDYRRGQPTCHRVYGEATAILAGDALLTLAFELLAQFGLKEGGAHHEQNALRLVHELASAAGYRELVCGQTMDLASEGRDDLSPREVEEIGRRKTAALIRAAARMGAIVGGANIGELESISRYGLFIGMAFQIVDDMLDIEGDPERMGKKTGTDLRKGKATYPVLWGREKACRRVMVLYQSAMKELEQFGSRAAALRFLAGRVVSRQD